MRGRVNERKGLHRDPKGGGEGRGLGEVVLSDVRVLKISAVGEGGWKRRGG